MSDLSSITFLDVLGVTIGHIIFGIGLTFLLDWEWIPLTQEERRSAKSLSQIKKELFSD